MSATTAHFTSERAPCGQTVGGDHLLDRDEQCLLSDELFYACGCRTLQHEFHDGSVSRKVIRHDGKVLVDELIAEH
jgi:hypothetical protein